MEGLQEPSAGSEEKEGREGMGMQGMERKGSKMEGMEEWMGRDGGNKGEGWITREEGTRRGMKTGTWKGSSIWGETDMHTHTHKNKQTKHGNIGEHE